MSSERKLVAGGQDFLISCWFLIYFMISWAVAGCTFGEKFFPKPFFPSSAEDFSCLAGQLDIGSESVHC